MKVVVYKLLWFSIEFIETEKDVYEAMLCFQEGLPINRYIFEKATIHSANELAVVN